MLASELRGRVGIDEERLTDGLGVAIDLLEHAQVDLFGQMKRASSSRLMLGKRGRDRRSRRGRLAREADVDHVLDQIPQLRVLGALSRERGRRRRLVGLDELRRHLGRVHGVEERHRLETLLEELEQVQREPLDLGLDVLADARRRRLRLRMRDAQILDRAKVVDWNVDRVVLLQLAQDLLEAVY